MISYKLMDVSHISQIAQLEKAYFSEPWSENSVSNELLNPLSLWVVACKEDELLGYVGSQIVLPEADMMNLAVREDFRRMGIAEALVTFLIEKLRERNVESLSLEVRASNVGAIALYEKLGFTQVGLRPNYYRKPKEDAKILRKEWSL